MGGCVPWDGHVINAVLKLMHSKMNFEKGGKYVRACRVCARVVCARVNSRHGYG